MTLEGAEPQQERSIHWRQRWWYALWVALLLGSLGLWAWWETPAASGVGHAVFKVSIPDLPPGSRVEAWAGPAKAWTKAPSAFLGPWPVEDPARPLPVPPVEIREGFRRWHQGYIPRLTSELVVFRIIPGQGAPRFAFYDLRQDLNAGLAGPHRRLMISAPLHWAALSEDAARPSPLLP